MVRCPVCGTRLNLAELVELNERQQRVRNAVETLRREQGRWPVAWEVGTLIGCSDRMARNYLRELETLGVICRPNGRQSGWALKRDHMTITLAA